MERGYPMDKKSDTEGLSVKEIEQFAKKHRFEVFFCLLFILASFFSFLFFGTGWATLLTMVGSVAGILVGAQVEQIFTKVLAFVFRQERTTQLVLAGVSLLVAILLPPIIFLTLGAVGGQSIHTHARNAYESRK